MLSSLGISWCGLYAKDLSTLSKFYEDVVGFKVLERDSRCCIFDAGPGAQFEMWSGGNAATPRKTPSEQSVVVGFLVERLEPLVEELRARGLEPDSPIDSYSGTRWIYYTDPEGNRFEFKDHKA